VEAIMVSAKPDDTNKLLEEIGYVNTRVYSNSDCIILPNRHMYSRFVKTVVAKPRLSTDNGNKLKTTFLKLFLDEVEKHSNKSKHVGSWILLG
jgi:hypothetical protein